jgi:ubiquinol-cytochrome c reductase iron-sulfur subunit
VSDDTPDDVTPDHTPDGTPEDSSPDLVKRESGANLPAEEPIANPGLPEHTWRPTDVDEGAAKRAERQVSAMFLVSAVCTVLFVVFYLTLDIGDNWETFGGLGASTLALGLSLGGALLLIGVGVIQWARKLMADHEIVEMRHPARSSDEDRAKTVEALGMGLEESGLGKHKMIRRTLLLSTGVLAAPLVILLRDLGPTPSQVANAAEGTGLKHTFWGTRQGIRVVRDVVGTPIRPQDLQVGDLVNAVPDGMLELEGVELLQQKAKSAVIVVKMDPEDITVGEGRDGWDIDGVICYSKICSHVGCPISLYERTTHHVLCPCHQSTFDLSDSAKVVFGPAGRPLPQLHLGLDEEGYLVAMEDFTEPVGPSFWDREK